MPRIPLLAAALAALLLSCATSGSTIPAGDYYSLGTAYFEMKRYPEAEKYFNLALRDEKTRAAAEYQLARVRYESGDSEGAATRFEALLSKDPENTLALRAAAYSWMKAGKYDKALPLYERIAVLLPESVDARFNYALALAAVDRLPEAIDRVKPYCQRKPDDREALLFLARTEQTLGRPEAVDHFAAALDLKDEPAVRVEFAQSLVSQGLYARAVENYDAALMSGGLTDTSTPKAATVRFGLAQALLIAGERERGLSELSAALKAGFSDKTALDSLVADQRIPNTAEVHAVLDQALAPEAPKSQ